MSNGRVSRLTAWFNEARNLRRFALWTIWFAFVCHPVCLLWQVIWPASWEKWGVQFVTQLSVMALWLSGLAWWQSTRVEERQIEAEEDS